MIVVTTFLVLLSTVDAAPAALVDPQSGDTALYELEEVATQSTEAKLNDE